jgi:poly(A) polymerase
MRETFSQFIAWLDGRSPLPAAADGVERAEGPELLEFLRIVLLHPRRGEAVRALVETGASKITIPELDALKGVAQPEQFHPEGDCLEHTALTMEFLKPDASFELALAALLHDIGKPRTYSVEDGGRIRFFGHETLSGRMARRIAAGMGLDEKSAERVEQLVALHMRIKDCARMNEKTLAKFVRDDLFSDLLELGRADCKASHGDMSIIEFAEKKAAEIGPAPPPPPPPLITGYDLIDMGHAPGPRFSVILGRIQSLRDAGKITTREEALELVRKEFPVSPSGGTAENNQP